MVFNPNPSGWFNATGSTARDPNLGQPSDPSGTGYRYPGVPSALPNVLAEQGMSDATIRYYMELLQTNAEALKQASGWEKIKLQAQREDALKALENAKAIAQIQADTSRYGTDQTRQQQMAELQEKQRQFDASHGLAYADAYAKYASTPDMMWALNDFKGAVGAASNGGYQTPIAGRTAPHAKTYEDFAALTGYGQGMARGGGGGGANGAGGSAAGTDDRLKAMRAVAQAIPPSETSGHDDQDWAALNAIKQLYFAGRPGSVERLGAERRKIAQAGIARLGYDPRLVEEEYRRGLPGQGSARSA